MNVRKSFSRRSMAWVLIFMLFFTAVLSWVLFRLRADILQALPASVPEDAESCCQEFQSLLQELSSMASFLDIYFLPAAAAFFLVSGLVLWLILRASLAGALKKGGFFEEKQAAAGKAEKARPARKAGAAGEPGSLEEDRQAEPDMKERYYLHFLSLLQREGRLIDFFKEDLGMYEDSQIGAAVRSIHENCRKAVEKAVAPKPVLEQQEGEEVNIPRGFDPAAIKLTGNVSGDPPFKGILRHRGWRAGKLELPTLSSTQDPGIIAPAEVEIQ